MFEIDIYIPSNIVPLNNETLFQHLMLLHLQRPLNSCFFLCFICKSLPHSHILGLVEISPNTHARVKLSSSVFFFVLNFFCNFIYKGFFKILKFIFFAPPQRKNFPENHISFWFLFVSKFFICFFIIKYFLHYKFRFWCISFPLMDIGSFISSINKWKR